MGQPDVITLDTGTVVGNIAGSSATNLTSTAKSHWKKYSGNCCAHGCTNAAEHGVHGGHVKVKGWLGWKWYIVPVCGPAVHNKHGNTPDFRITAGTVAVEDPAELLAHIKSWKEDVKVVFG